jgi:hypothetical protein
MIGGISKGNIGLLEGGVGRWSDVGMVIHAAQLVISLVKR